MWKNLFKELKRKDHQRYLGGLDIFKYIGPGLLVTVGVYRPRELGPLILLRGPIMVMHCCG